MTVCSDNLTANHSLRKKTEIHIQMGRRVDTLLAVFADALGAGTTVIVARDETVGECRCNVDSVRQFRKAEVAVTVCDRSVATGTVRRSRVQLDFHPRDRRSSIGANHSARDLRNRWGLVLISSDRAE
jgi:hypothetical protein